VVEGGSRLAIIFNGSPLFTGSAGSGESEIRRWIIEHDWLEAIVALPNQLFYNTDIGTYIWILTNRKRNERKGKVQLVDATTFSRKMRKSLGDKRNEVTAEQIAEIVRTYGDFVAGPHCKIFDNADFGYRRITVERPLRLRYRLTDTALATILADKAVRKFLQPDRSGGQRALADPEAALVTALQLAAGTSTTDEAVLTRTLEAALARSGLKLPTPARKAILAALAERDETAPIILGSKGDPLADPELRDNEDVPLTERIDDYFAREVTPHVPDAWINEKETDTRDGKVGKVGYEINFNRYFYQYQPPRPLAEIDAELRVLEQEIAAMLAEVTA